MVVRLPHRRKIHTERKLGPRCPGADIETSLKQSRATNIAGKKPHVPGEREAAPKNEEPRKILF